MFFVEEVCVIAINARNRRWEAWEAERIKAFSFTKSAVCL